MGARDGIFIIGLVRGRRNRTASGIDQREFEAICMLRQSSLDQTIYTVCRLGCKDTGSCDEAPDQGCDELHGYPSLFSVSVKLYVESETNLSGDLARGNERKAATSREINQNNHAMRPAKGTVGCNPLLADHGGVALRRD